MVEYDYRLFNNAFFIEFAVRERIHHRITYKKIGNRFFSFFVGFKLRIGGLVGDVEIAATIVSPLFHKTEE